MSDCDVCLGEMDYSDGPAQVWHQAIVKARKVHKCDECEKEISPGTKYERIKMLFDGDWSYWTICLLCSEIHTVFACGEGRMIGNFWNDMEEIVFPNLKMSSKCFGELSAAGKAEVVQRWQQWKGLRA